MHAYEALNILRFSRLTLHKNQQAEELVCELLKNLSRYQVVIAGLQHRNANKLNEIIKVFPFLERNKIPASVLNIQVNNQESLKLAYKDFINEICKSEYFKKFTSVNILKEIIYSGFPIAELYEMLEADGRYLLCKILPGIKPYESNKLEDKGPDKYRDIYDYKIMNIPVTYQGMQYDFNRLMKYVLNSKAANKNYAVGFARGAEVNLNELQLDFTLLELMQKTLQENNIATSEVTWRTDLMNNYVLHQQQTSIVNFLRSIQSLSFSQRVLYAYGMFTTLESVYKFILHDIEHKFDGVCKFRYPLDVAYVLGGNTLEHFRFLPLSLKFAHEFIAFIFASIDGEYRWRQVIDKFSEITVPFFYISALDRILFNPLTRSQAAWMESADVGDGVQRSWAPYIVIVMALVMAHSIAFAIIKNLTSLNFEKMMFSRDKLIEMLGLIFSAKLQNILQDKYDEKMMMQDSRETYALFLLAGACLFIMFEILWTFYVTPGIKFVLDLGDKYYPANNEPDAPNELEITQAQTEIMSKMRNIADNQPTMLKEGLYFWSKRDGAAATQTEIQLPQANYAARPLSPPAITI